MLGRRTIALADGSVRSYLALPPDYQDLPPQGRPQFERPDRFLPFGRDERDVPPGGGGMHFPPGGRASPRREEMLGRGGGGQSDYWNSLGLDGRGQLPPEGSLKRKHGDGDERERERDEFARVRQQVLQYGNPNLNPEGVGHHVAGTSALFRDPLDFGQGLDEDLRASKNMRIGSEYEMQGGDDRMPHRDVDQQALKKAFLQLVQVVFERKRSYLENGKKGPLQCLVCDKFDRASNSKDFRDTHELIMHAYNSHSTDSQVDHLALHKALCVLMGWNHLKVPDNSKIYRSLPANEAEANKEDLILWPPVVIIHNTLLWKGKDGRMDGMGNKFMDKKLKDLGFGGGKSRAMFSKEGHLGIVLVKYAADQSGLKEALRLAEYFEKDHHGRKGWAQAQSSPSPSWKDEENNPNLVKVDEKTGRKERILYGYIATVLDLHTVEADTRKKSSIESMREMKP